MRHSIALLLLISVSLSQSSLLFVGTYQNPPGGIQIYNLQENGNLVSLGVGSTKSPSSLALHPTGKFLYSSSETQSGNFDAWRITNSSGTISLVRINTVPSKGDYPAHLSVHPSGNFLLGTNYGTGNFLVFPINSDGSLKEAILNTLPGVGSKGLVPNQNGPHAHQMITGTNGEIYGVDLGSDSLFSWNFNQGALSVKEVVSFPKGAGPRHAVHGPNGMVYVVAEYGNRVFAFQKGRVGELRPIQNLTSLPPGFSGYSAAGEIRVHPNGKFLYITNRGANNIAIYNITQSGALKKAGFASTGNYPRGMTIAPTGDWMVIGNQYGNSLFVMKIQENGQLLYKSQVSTASPVDIVFHSYPSTLGKIAS